MRSQHQPHRESEIVKRKPDALIYRRNWQDTRAYLRYCEEVRQNAPGSVDFTKTALNHLLNWLTSFPINRAPASRADPQWRP